MIRRSREVYQGLGPPWRSSAPAPRIQPIQRADGEFRVFRVDRRRELELRGRDRADVRALVCDPTLRPSLDFWSAWAATRTRHKNLARQSGRRARRTWPVRRGHGAAVIHPRLRARRSTSFSAGYSWLALLLARQQTQDGCCRSRQVHHAAALVTPAQLPARHRQNGDGGRLGVLRAQTRRPGNRGHCRLGCWRRDLSNN